MNLPGIISTYKINILIFSKTIMLLYQKGCAESERSENAGQENEGQNRRAGKWWTCKMLPSQGWKMTDQFVEQENDGHS